MRKDALIHATGGKSITNNSPVIAKIGPHKGRVGKVTVTGTCDPYFAKMNTGTTNAVKVGFVLPIQEATCCAYMITQGCWMVLVNKGGIKQWSGRVYPDYNSTKFDNFPEPSTKEAQEKLELDQGLFDNNCPL